MPRYNRDRDWIEEIPENRWSGPYRDYGWEADQSSLPEFRDPSVHLTPWERREVEMWRHRNQRLGRENPFRGRGGRRGMQIGERRERDFAPMGYYAEPWGRGFDEMGNFSTAWDWQTPGPYTGVGPKNYRRPDDRIEEDVCERLTQHGRVDATDIKISVEDGEVTMKGWVADRGQKRMAEDSALSVPGVWDVHNRLTINRYPEGAKGRTVRPGKTGVFPLSDEDEAPEDAEAEWMGDFLDGESEEGAQ